MKRTSIPKGKIFSTSQLAKAVGLHPNTIRLYESWGWISSARRKKNGYRQFTKLHLLQIQLLKLIFASGLGNQELRKRARKIVSLVAQCDIKEAKKTLESRRALVRREKRRAEEAIKVIEAWQKGTPEKSDETCTIKEAAKRLEVTPDTLYTWERNNLLIVPRDENNGYRRYGQKELNRLLLIRMLRQVGYSISAILRLAHQLEGRAAFFRNPGTAADARTALDTPYEHEAEVPAAADKWLSWLEDEEKRGKRAARLLTELARLRV